MQKCRAPVGLEDTLSASPRSCRCRRCCRCCWSGAAPASTAPATPPPPPALLELLGELSGAQQCRGPGRALCKAEYLGSTCRLPPCGMLNACLLVQGHHHHLPRPLGRRVRAHALAPAAGTLPRVLGREPKREGAMQSCVHSPPPRALRAWARLALHGWLLSQSERMLGSAWRWLQNLGARNCPALRGRRVILPSPRACPRTLRLPPSRAPPPPLPGSAGFSCSDSGVAPAPSWLLPGFGPFCSPDTPPPPTPARSPPPRPPPPLPAPAHAGRRRPFPAPHNSLTAVPCSIPGWPGLRSSRWAVPT